jgi:hypothetical protein
MMPPIEDSIIAIAIETSKRQRAEAHGAQSHARCRSGRSVSHGLYSVSNHMNTCGPLK